MWLRSPDQCGGKHAMSVQMQVTWDDTGAVDVLSPDSIECIRKSMGDDTKVNQSHDGLLLTFTNGPKYATVFLPGYWRIGRPGFRIEDLAAINRGYIGVSKKGTEGCTAVVNAITNCAGSSSSSSSSSSSGDPQPLEGGRRKKSKKSRKSRKAKKMTRRR